MDGSPRDPVELALVHAWQGALDRRGVRVSDDFHALGGRKAAAVAVSETLRETLGVWLPPSSVAAFPRLEQLAAVYRPLVAPDRFAEPLAFNHDRRPGMREDDVPDLFVVHGVGGEVVSAYPLAALLPASWRAWGLEVASLRGAPHEPFDVPRLAARHIATIRRVRRRGTIALAGHSLGGVVAYEMARQLAGDRLRVAVLLLLDGEPPEDDARRPVAYAGAERERLLDSMCRAGFFPPASTVGVLDRLSRITADMFDAAEAYAIEPLADVRAVHFRTGACEGDAPADSSPWEAYLGDRVRTVPIGGDHYTMYASPHVERFAAQVARSLRPHRASADGAREP